MSLDITVYAGATTPTAAPADFVDALERVVVRNVDNGVSTFQLLVRADPPDSAQNEFPVLAGGLVAAGNRFKLVASFGSTIDVLVDGVVVHQELMYDDQLKAFMLSVIGEDLSIYMRQTETFAEWPQRAAAQVAREIFATYGKYGLTATVVQSADDATPPANGLVRQQTGTDLDFLRALARPFGYVVGVRPGTSASGNGVAYWGPPTRSSSPLATLSVATGAGANVNGASARYDGAAAATFTGDTHSDDSSATALEASGAGATLPGPALAADLASASPLARTRLFIEPGIIGATATAYAKSRSSTENRRAVNARAVIDGTAYGAIVRPGSVVPLRGLGTSYEGLYYVERVEHTIVRGNYEQRLELSREGLGSTVTSFA
jgi:phage protein D